MYKSRLTICSFIFFWYHPLRQRQDCRYPKFLRSLNLPLGETFIVHPWTMQCIRYCPTYFKWLTKNLPHPGNLSHIFWHFLALAQFMYSGSDLLNVNPEINRNRPNFSFRIFCPVEPRCVSYPRHQLKGLSYHFRCVTFRFIPYQHAFTSSKLDSQTFLIASYRIYCVNQFQLIGFTDNAFHIRSLADFLKFCLLHFHKSIFAGLFQHVLRFSQVCTENSS